MENMHLIVLSCDAYLETRIKDMDCTFGKHFNITYLIDSSFLNSEKIIGYDTPQNYDGIQDKYLSFFRNYEFTKDYYFFIDDDTFVIKKNIEKLELPPSDHPFCFFRRGYLDADGTDQLNQQTGYPLWKIRGENTHLPIEFPSGGSGFILSKSACLLIQNYLDTTPDEIIPRSGHSDVTLAFWLRNCDVEMIETDLFWWDRIGHMHVPFIWKGKLRNFLDKDIENAITFHYVKDQEVNNYFKKFYQDYV
jgi:hypothetical protein